MERDRRGIQSIEVGGQLLLALAADGRPMMLRDLAKAAGMAPAKAHPYLVSFGKLGLIEQDATSGFYQLGPFALQLGLTRLRQLNAIREATTAVRQLVGEIDQTVALAVWGNQGPTIVHIEQSSHPLHVNMRPGTVMSLLETATGKVFAACLPPKITGPLTRREMRLALRMDGSRHRITRAEIDASLTVVRDHGMAQAVGQPIPGINALSAPVFDHSGQIELAITALGPAGTFDPSWDGVIARSLRACAAEVSRRIGAGPREPAA